MVWAPLLACPAVFSILALLDKPAVAPVRQSVITFENSLYDARHYVFFRSKTIQNLAQLMIVGFEKIIEHRGL
jgi:hypothetical protein